MPRYQPDPLLREGQRSRSWAWLMGAIIVVVIALTFIALSGEGSKTAQHRGPNQAATTGQAPASPMPGRGNADAPRTGNATTPR